MNLIPLTYWTAPTLLLFVVMGDEEIPMCKMKSGEWSQHCDTGSGCYWPSDVTSERGSSAMGDPGVTEHDNGDG